MTQRVTVSLPDEIAARLQEERNASAYVTEAIRDRIAREQTARLLAEQGFTSSPDGRERARRRLAEARERMTADRWSELRGVGRSSAV